MTKKRYEVEEMAYPMGEEPAMDLEKLRLALQVAAVRYLAEDLVEYPNRPTFHKDVVQKIYGALEEGRLEAERRAVRGE